jgi:hypothetical protein
MTVTVAFLGNCCMDEARERFVRLGIRFPVIRELDV